jgi:hypothetical protein
MPVSLYMDHHVPSAVTEGVRERGVDVLTAYEDGAHRLSDPELLQRASGLSRVLFTRDSDFLAEAARLQESGTGFSGVIYAHPLGASIGTCVADLEIIAKVGDTSDLANTVLYLPL